MHIGGEGLLSDRALKETVKVQKEYIIVDQQTGEVTIQVKKLMSSVKPFECLGSPPPLCQ